MHGVRYERECDGERFAIVARAEDDFGETYVVRVPVTDGDWFKGLEEATRQLKDFIA